MLSLDQASRDATAFSTPEHGLLHYARTPQGAKNSPAQLSCTIESILREPCRVKGRWDGYPPLNNWAFSYIDDVQTVAANDEEALELYKCSPSELPRIVPELGALVPQAAASLRGLPCADRLRRTTYFPLRSE